MKKMIFFFLLAFISFPIHSQSRDLWDLHFQVDVTAVTGFAVPSGAETDGEFFYVSNSLNNQIAKFDLSGNWIENFPIPNIPFGLEDLSTDGEYFYSGSGSSYTIFKMDFITQLIVGDITAPISIDAIAYDPNEDAFWITNWQSDVLMLIDRNGALMNQMVFNDNALGLTHDTFNPGEPFLWAYTGVYTGGDGIVTQYLLPGFIPTGLSHNVTDDFPGTHAGGLFCSNEVVPGVVILGGIAKGTTSYLFGYEISSTGADPNLILLNQLSNYPNPFNPTTKISFSVPQTFSFAIIEIYNLKGQKVKMFTFPNGSLGTSEQNVVWNGRDEINKPVSSGIYVYQLKVDGEVQKSKKMMLMK